MSTYSKPDSRQPFKRETGKTTPHQDRWLAMLHACPGVETYLCRPSQLEQIAELLR